MENVTIFYIFILLHFIILYIILYFISFKNV